MYSTDLERYIVQSLQISANLCWGSEVTSLFRQSSLLEEWSRIIYIYSTDLERYVVQSLQISVGGVKSRLYSGSDYDIYIYIVQI